jgi:hypothetical protein
VPTSKDSLKERLSRYGQIKLSVIGRKSGRTIIIPVWFVLEGDKLVMIPYLVALAAMILVGRSSDRRPLDT